MCEESMKLALPFRISISLRQCMIQGSKTLQENAQQKQTKSLCCVRPLDLKSRVRQRLQIHKHAVLL